MSFVFLFCAAQLYRLAQKQQLPTTNNTRGILRAKIAEAIIVMMIYGTKLQRLAQKQKKLLENQSRRCTNFTQRSSVYQIQSVRRLSAFSRVTAVLYRIAGNFCEAENFAIFAIKGRPAIDLK